MRSRPLDILRFAAVFLVLGRHLVVCPREISGPFHYFTEIWHRGGWVGVDLFFVLSGFLVAGLLFKEHLQTGKFSPGRFLLRRGFKIYPAFWVLIVATVIAMPQIVTERRVISELLFVQNYFQGLWGHTWSLAVEEHFYLLLTLAIGILPFVRKAMPIVLAAIAALCLGLRIYTASTHAFSNAESLFPTHLRLDSLGFGVLLSYCRYYYPLLFGRFQNRWLLLPGIMALVPCFVFELETTPFIYTIGFTLNYIGSGMILLAVIGTSPKSIISSAVAFLGARSYSLYLWHIPVQLAAWRISSNWYLYAVVYLIGSIIVGIGMNVVVETPLLKIRDFFFPAAIFNGAPTPLKSML